MEVGAAGVGGGVTLRLQRRRTRASKNTRSRTPRQTISGTTPTDWGVQSPDGGARVQFAGKVWFPEISSAGQSGRVLFKAGGDVGLKLETAAGTAESHRTEIF